MEPCGTPYSILNGKATVFKYPTLGMKHEAVEEVPVEEVREQASRACTAKVSE